MGLLSSRVRRRISVAFPRAPDVVDEEESFNNPGDAEILKKLNEQDAAYEGLRGASLWAVSAADGKKLAEYKLDSPPIFDGMIAANGRLYVVTKDGEVLCMEKSN